MATSTSSTTAEQASFEKRLRHDPDPGHRRRAFARRALAPRVRHASLHIVWACVQYAASVQYQRVTLSDLSAAARCLRTTRTRCIQRLPRHVANRLPTRRGAARGATQASRRSVCTRSCNPRCVRFRFLAPQSLCRPVPSVVRRITQRNRRPRKDACRIGRAAVRCVIDTRARRCSSTRVSRP